MVSAVSSEELAERSDSITDLDKMKKEIEIENE